MLRCERGKSGQRRGSGHERIRNVRRVVPAALIPFCAILLLATNIGRGIPTDGARSLRLYESGWKIERYCAMPEAVTSLASWPEAERLYVGTGPKGGVFELNMRLPRVLLPLTWNAGAPTSVPECYVNALAIHDLDLDGTPELIASTCQVEPRGRPRLHVWSLLAPPVPRCSASPDIKSSWSHGLGYIPATDTQPLRLFGTYCGFGEIVEYKLAKDEDNAGFHRETLAWKQVGQLPASGESLCVDQVDNDGKDKVVVAVGYARHQAAIRIYDVNWSFAFFASARHTGPQIALLAIKTPGATRGHRGNWIMS